MRGAHRFWLGLWFFAALAAGSGAASADEFGNILVPSVENVSRQASAQALGAASLILKGLQSRELRNRDSEREAFVGAAQGLRSAADAMDGILKQASTGGDLGKVLGMPFILPRDMPERDRAAFIVWVSRTGTNVDTLKTRADVFAVFARDTRQIAGVVESSTGKYDREVFRHVTDDLSLYLRMGDVVATIMRAAS